MTPAPNDARASPEVATRPNWSCAPSPLGEARPGTICHTFDFVGRTRPLTVRPKTVGAARWGAGPIIGYGQITPRHGPLPPGEDAPGGGQEPVRA
jgi:hypothetical protein